MTFCDPRDPCSRQFARRKEILKPTRDAVESAYHEQAARLSDCAARKQVKVSSTRIACELPNWANVTHATAAEIPALGAQCHTELGRAVLDSSGSWRAERKLLRTSVARVAPAVADRLDEGLRLACQGDPSSLLELGREILGALGGELRTYSERR